ncbi:hypothetical protein BGX28_005522 [Mortierella sp. GBA30]|nr:hypothetical protein BGX28_005522 [Mortierella sp. GBA30]
MSSMYYPIDKELQEKIVCKLEFNDLYNVEGLYRHQEFVRRYLSPHTPYKGLLIFHSLGSGKSLICISVAVDHYLHDGKRCLLVTKGSSGRENFKREIEHYYEMAKFSAKNYPDDKGTKIHPREYNKIFVLNHYMALHNTVCVMTDRDVEREFSNMILVFDEIHNIRKLKSTIPTGDDEEEQLHVYDSLERIVRLAKNTKVMLATATPMTNDIGQLNSTIDLLGSTSYHGIVSYNAEIKDKPKKIFHGVDGYLTNTKVYVSRMRSHQLEYHVDEQRKGTPKDIYRTLTHVSLFAFPGDGLYGRKIYDEGIMVSVKGSRDIITVKNKTRKKVTFEMFRVIDTYRQYLTGDALRDCGCKYWELMDILENKHPNVGPIFIFVEEVKGSGLLLLANIFEAHGYELYVGENLPSIGKGKRFTICVGDQSVCPNQSDRLDGFNHRKNVNGEYVRVLIGSKVVGESITLRNVRQFHVMTIHWNDSTIEQAVGRVVRSGSHSQLEESERKVDIFIHAAMCDTTETGGKMGRTIGGDQGTDMYKLRICNDKQQLIAKMERKLKRHAVDRYIIQEEPNGKYVSSSDPTTFILHYMERYATTLVPKLETRLGELFATSNSIPMDDILEQVNDDYAKVVVDLLCKIVVNNIRILGGKYLREDVDGFFLTDDPSTPFFFVRDREVDEEEVVKPKYIIPSYKGKAKVDDSVECMQQLRDMPFIQRISFVEKYVARGRKIPRILEALFIKYHGKLYHIMCYRAPGEAYTAVLPIPKQDVLECRMRVLGDGGWNFIENGEMEAKVVAKMEDKYAKLMSAIDQHEEAFLVISLIDGKPRIRTRFLETSDKGSRDKRYVRKGRSLSSILKPTLAMTFAYISVLLHKETHRTTTEEMRTKYINLDEHATPYGYKSMKKLAKSRPHMFDAFVDVMERGSVSQLVERMVDLMMRRGKCIFL